MPRKSSTDKKTASESVLVEKKEEPVKPSAPAPKKPVSKKKPELKVAFSRWFMSKKFKAHWAVGMQAYADTSVRRTMAEWDKLFQNY
jgi:hypothetical protein